MLLVALVSYVFSQDQEVCREGSCAAPEPSEVPSRPVRKPRSFDITPFLLEKGGFDDFFKPGDVIAACGVKTGTHWVLNILHQIRTGGDDSFDDLNVITPWIGHRHFPNEQWEQQREALHSHVFPDTNVSLVNLWANPKYAYRAFKTHNSPLANPTKGGKVLPVRERPDIKYIVAMRNPADVILSWIEFTSSFSDEYRSMWSANGTAKPHPPEHVRFEKFVRSGKMVNHAVNWWPYRHDKNVLMLHYSNMMKDPSGTIDTIAKFVGVDIPENRREAIEKYSSYQWMREHRFKFEMRLWNNPEFDRNGTNKCWTSIRNGINGESKHVFSTEQLASIEAAIAKIPYPELRDYIRHGGALPLA